MELDITTYRNTLENSHILDANEILNNLRNDFISIKSQLNSIFNVHKYTSEHIFKRIECTKSYQKKLIDIISEDTPFRNFLRIYRTYIRSISDSCIEGHETRDNEKLRSVEDVWKSRCNLEYSHDSAASKIMKAVFILVREHLKVTDESGIAVNDLFQVIEDSIKELPMPNNRQTINKLFLSNIGEIKSFLFSLLTTSVNIERVTELTLLLYTKLAGLDSFLEWLNYAIDQIPANVKFMRTDVLYSVLHSLMVRDGYPNSEIRGHVDQFLAIDIATKDMVKLDEVISILFIAVLRMCKMEQDNDEAPPQVHTDVDHNPFPDIYVWTYGSDIDHIKSAYPDSLSTRLNSSSQKPTNHQVVCTQKKIIMVNNFGQVRSRCIRKSSSNDQLKKSLSLCWSPVQFPDPSVKVDSLCVGFASKNEKQHILALSRSGQIFSWGGGNYGKLGHGDTEDIKCPKLITSLRGYVVKQISAGTNHSTAVTETGLSFIWGDGLSFNHIEDEKCLIPKRLKQGIMSNVICGPQCTFMVCINKRNVTYMGSSQADSLCYRDHFMLPVHPIPIKWLPHNEDRKFCDSNFQKIKKVVCNSTGLLALLVNGQLYSVGHGLVLGCPNCQTHEYFERVKTMVDVHVLDVALSETHAMVLGENVIYSWSLTTSALTLIEESLSQSVTNVFASFSIRDNKQINMAWSKQDDSPTQCPKSKQTNPYLGTTSVVNSITHFKNILTKVMDVTKYSPYFEEIVPKLMELLLYCLKSESFTDKYLEYIGVEVISDLMDLLVKIYDRGLTQKQMITDVILNSVNVLYRCLEDRANCISSMLLSVTSLSLLSNGHKFLLERLLLSLDDPSSVDRFTKLYKLNCVILGDLLITICHTLTSDVIGVVQEHLNNKKTSNETTPTLTDLTTVLNGLAGFGYRTYFARIRKYYPSVHNPVSHLCSLLPMINSVIGSLKSFLLRCDEINKMSQWTLTENARYINSLFSKSPMGCILFDVLFFLYEEEHHEDVFSLIPHISSMIISLNDINSILPIVVTDNALEIHFPLHEFSSYKHPTSTLQESMPCWTWLIDLQRLSGLLYGKLLTKILKSVEFSDDERIKYWLKTPLFNHINQLHQRRKTNDQCTHQYNENYKKMFTVVAVFEAHEYDLWRNEHLLHSSGLQIYATIVDIVKSKWSYLDIQTICSLHGITYTFETIINSLNDSIRKMMERDVFLDDLSEHEICGLNIHTEFVKDKCSFLRNLLQESINDNETKFATEEQSKETIEALDLMTSRIAQMKGYNSQKSKSEECIHGLCSEAYAVANQECFRWLLEIFPGLNDFLSPDHSMAVTGELSKMQYSVLVKRAKYNRAATTIKGINKLFHQPVQLLDSVFIQIIAGLLQSVSIIHPDKQLSDDQISILKTLFRVLLTKLKSYKHPENDTSSMPQRLWSSILGFISVYNFMHGDIIKFLIEENVCGSLLALTHEHPLTTTDKWLVVEGDGDANLRKMSHMIAWCTLEDLMLNLSTLSTDFPDNAKEVMELQILSFVVDIYQEINEDVFLKIFDLYTILNLCKLLYQKSNLFHRNSNIARWIELLLKVATLEKDEDAFNIFYSKYAINVSAIEFLSIVLCDMIETNSNIADDDIFKNLFGRLSKFYSHLMNVVPILETRRVVDAVQCRINSFNETSSTEGAKGCSNDWISGNSNFDRERSFYCDFVSGDKVSVAIEGMDQFLAVNLEIMDSGVWQVTLDVTCSDNVMEFSCGFIANDDNEWPSDYQSLMRLKKILQPISLSGKGCLSHRIECVIDINECLVYFFNVYNRVQTFSDHEGVYRFFLCSKKSQFMMSGYQIHVVTVKQMRHSNMYETNKFYNNSVICHDHYIVRSRIYDAVRKFCERRPDLMFKFIIIPLRQQLHWCTRSDLYVDKKMTDSTASTTIMFALFLLCGFSKQHQFYRGEMCTYLSTNDESEHVGIIIDFKTKLKSKFAGLNFVDKLCDNSEIICCIHSLSTNCSLRVPMKHLVKDEMYEEDILLKSFKDMLPDHLEDIISLLLDLSKCISLKFFDTEVTNYEEMPWLSDSSSLIVAEFHFIRCLSSYLFLKIIGRDEILEWCGSSRNDHIVKKIELIFQNVVFLATKPSPMKKVSDTNDVMCCSLRLFEGLMKMQAEIDNGVAKNYAKLFFQSRNFMDIGSYLCKREQRIISLALKRAAFSNELIDSFIHSSSSQISTMESRAVTFSLRRRLVDSSATSDHINMLQMIQTPASEYDSNPHEADQIQEMDNILVFENNQNRSDRQRLIHDFFTIQTQKKRTSRVCPICDLVLKMDNECMYSHLSLKHAHNCSKSFQHQASKGIDANGLAHDLDIRSLHCATITNQFYCVCQDFLSRKISNKDVLNCNDDYENFFNEHYQKSPLVGWSGTMSSEEYFYQDMKDVRIYEPAKCPEVEEVGILGENIIKEINESKLLLSPNEERDETWKAAKNMCDEVPFVCQLNSSAITKALVRLEYSTFVMSSRTIIVRLFKMIYRRESKKEVSFMIEKYLLSDMSFVCDMIRLVEFDRIKFDMPKSNFGKDIQVIHFRKEDFLLTLVIGLELSLNSSFKVHGFIRKFIDILGNILTSAKEYYGLSRDSDRTILTCPSRLLAQILTNSVIRVLGNIISEKTDYEYWQEDIESIIEWLAFGAVNGICGANDKIWCLRNITRIFQMIRRNKSASDIRCINQADLCDDLHVEDTQVVHLTNVNIKKCISTKNRQCVVTADYRGVVRIWDLSSKIASQQYLQHTLHFTLEDLDSKGYNEASDCSETINNNPRATTNLKDDISNYLQEVGAQQLAISCSGTYVAESIGACLNIWSTRSLYSHSHVLRFSSTVSALVFPEQTFHGIYGAPVDQLLVCLADGQLLLLRILDNGARITQKVLKTKLKDNVFIVAAVWDNEKCPIAVGYSDGSIALTDQRIDAECTELETIHCKEISQLLYIPYPSKFGHHLLASSAVEEIRIAIWRVDKLLCAISLSDSVTCMEWMPRSFVECEDAYIIMTGDARGMLQFWQFDSFGQRVNNILRFNGHICTITTLRLCENTGLLASGCKKGWLNVWCLKDKSLLSTFRDSEAVIAVEWTPTNNLVVSWSGSQYCNILHHFNDSSFQKSGLRQWALVRKWFLQNSYAVSVKHLENLKKLSISINHLIIQQYNEEESFVKCGYSVAFSQYIQTLFQFVFSLDLLSSFIPCIKSETVNVSIGPRLTWPRELLKNHIFQRRTLCHTLNSHPFLPRFNDNHLEWLFDLDELIKVSKGICFDHDSSNYVIPKWWWLWCFESDAFSQQYADSKWQNRYWTWDMQSELSDWFTYCPEEWISNYKASTMIWGCGKKGELNRVTNRDWDKPEILNVDGIQQVVCGSSLTLVINGDGNLMACGEGLEIVFNPYLREESSRMIIVPVLSDFKIAQVAASRGSESHVIAVTVFGDVYSWGMGSHGKLGHGHSTSLKKPKLIEGLRGKGAIQAACGHMHSAVVTASGKLYTFGMGAIGQLGVGMLTGSDTPRLVAFDDEDVKIGNVACGYNHTLALSQYGSSLYAFGDGAFGKLGLGDSNNRFSPASVDINNMILLKVMCGSNFSTALTDRGDVLVWGHGDFIGLEERSEGAASSTCGHADIPTINHHLVNKGVTLVDISAGNDTMFAVTTAGLVYGWGSNNGNILLSATSLHVYLPELIEINKKQSFKQISCGRYHVCASSYSPHSYRYDIPTGPQLIHTCSDNIEMTRYPALQSSGLNRFDLTARLVTILYWNELIRLTWQMWLPLSNQKYAASDYSDDNVSSDWPFTSPQSYLLPDCNWPCGPLDHFRRDRVRRMLNKESIDNFIYRYISGSMITNRTYGSLVKINRIEKTESVFKQTCHQVLQMHPMELRLPWRAWKVKLVHEGADDAGGAYDETISEMCNELQSSESGLEILIPSPNDTTLFLPNPDSNIGQRYFHFLGILMGAAIRTKKPLDLNLDPLFWKLMTKSVVTVEDLRRLDTAYFNSLSFLNNVENCDPVYLKEVLSVDFFVVFSVNRKECEVVYKGSKRDVTKANLSAYVHHAISYRLHEFDRCVASVREGLAGVSPLLFLDLMTWDQLEKAVCGSRKIDVSVLRSIARYVDTDESNEIFAWFWDIIDGFTELEKSLFLRFVTGKSRLPSDNSKIPFRLFIYLSKQPVSSLPQSQTCFNQIRLPRYRCRADLESRLKIAISQCRSIDMDDYMLVRNRDI